jgi:predicted RNase H-like HicB family nuclease
MSVDHYTFRVTWSPEDDEHVGLCAEFPSLSWLARSPEAALKGIRRLVAEAVADMQASGEPVPAPLAAMTALSPALKQTKNQHLMVTRKAEEVFGDPATAADWLNSKNAALGGVTPLSLLSTNAGAQSVLDTLGRIEHGVF